MSENRTKSALSAVESPAWLEVVRRHVGSLRYGVVQIVVHDSQVTQIDKTERVRLGHCDTGTIAGPPEAPAAKSNQRVAD